MGEHDAAGSGQIAATGAGPTNEPAGAAGGSSVSTAADRHAMGLSNSAGQTNSTTHTNSAKADSSHPDNRRRRNLIGTFAVIALAVGGYYAIPFITRSFNTVSTDDAYVNGHVTFVAPRVPGQIATVLVDDNDRVHKGDVLLTLDKEPYKVAVDVKRAAYEVAVANVNSAHAQVLATIGMVRSARFKVERAIEDVHNQVDLLKANIASLDKAKVELKLADSKFKRAKDLKKQPGAISDQEYDQYEEVYNVSKAQVTLAEQQVHQTRASLGLLEQPTNGDLSSTPPDLDQNFSAVREAVAMLQQSAATLGIIPSSFDLTPKKIIKEFYDRDPLGDLDRIYNKIIPEAPALKQAQAQLLEARSNLDKAELDLHYCDVVAEIDGVVTRRSANPGNNVVAGQSLMAVRSLTEIWIDANFKETQLGDLRIGQAVDLDVDMYGGRESFKGRIAGFTMGTGSTLALLPAENATGNFVKVVQRIPVRIELIDYNAETAPLFIGLSVTPYVRIHEKPTGPDAGKVLRPRVATIPGASPAEHRP